MTSLFEVIKNRPENLYSSLLRAKKIIIYSVFISVAGWTVTQELTIKKKCLTKKWEKLPYIKGVKKEVKINETETSTTHALPPQKNKKVNFF